ncbi:MAG TPA: glycosyltransferase family 39 protein [Acidimicrobiales bacterium]
MPTLSADVPNPGAPPLGVSGVVTEGSPVDDGSARWWPWAAAIIVVVAGVLRLWDLGHGALSPDETYSAISAHLPLGQIPSWIADTDPHPPLFYLVLHPLAAVGASDAWLRAPSAVAALAAVVVFVVWQRRRGWEGLLAAALLAIMPFQLAYGREARMYGLLLLFGALAGWACWSWLGRERLGWAVVAAAVGLGAALSHATGLILLPGLFLLPGLRRDRPAWQWRGVIAGGGLAFVALWGAALARGQRGTTYYETTSLRTVSIAVNELVAAVPGNRWLVLPLLAAGAYVLIRFDPRMGRVLVCAALVPAGLALLVGVRQPVVVPKTFAVVSWAVPVVLAALVSAVWRRLAIAGVAVLGLVLLQIIPWIGPTLDQTANTDGLVHTLLGGVADGDAVAAHPESTMVRWYLADRRPGVEHPIDLGLDDTVAFVVGEGPWTGRVWVVDATYLTDSSTVDAPACSPGVQVGDFFVRCYQLDPSSHRATDDRVPAIHVPSRPGR